MPVYISCEALVQWTVALVCCKDVVGLAAEVCDFPKVQWQRNAAAAAQTGEAGGAGRLEMVFCTFDWGSATQTHELLYPSILASWVGLQLYSVPSVMI